MFGYAQDVLEENIKKLREEQEKKEAEIKGYDNRLNHINSFYRIKDKISGNKSCISFGLIMGIAVVCGSLAAVLSSISVIISLLGWASIYVGVKSFYNMKSNKLKLITNYADLSNMPSDEVQKLKEEYILQKEKCCYDNYKIQSEILEYSKLLTKIAEYSDILEDTKKAVPLYLADNKEEYEILLSCEIPRTEEEKQKVLTETSKEFIKRFPKM